VLSGGRPLGGCLDHVGRHELESMRQMFGEHLVRPVEVEYERLQSVKLPQHVLRRRAPVAGTRSRHTIDKYLHRESKKQDT